MKKTPLDKAAAKARETLWRSFIKAHVLKEYFEKIDHDTPPEFDDYTAWIEGLLLILSEVIEGVEEAHAFITEIDSFKVEVTT
ncbi:MAG: hypothetical protein NTV58_06640 [Deltaproteobacteria bacterium]|nr:hypothetical protein [Deltaproteobacteria bacterium]